MTDRPPQSPSPDKNRHTPTEEEITDMGDVAKHVDLVQREAEFVRYANGNGAEPDPITPLDDIQ
jgi:hypothetical protein